MQAKFDRTHQRWPRHRLVISMQSLKSQGTGLEPGRLTNHPHVAPKISTSVNVAITRNSHAKTMTWCERVRTLGFTSRSIFLYKKHTYVPILLTNPHTSSIWVFLIFPFLYKFKNIYHLKVNDSDFPEGGRSR